jgi:hypothetical protein
MEKHAFMANPPWVAFVISKPPSVLANGIDLMINSRLLEKLAVFPVALFFQISR